MGWKRGKRVANARDAFRPTERARFSRRSAAERPARGEAEEAAVRSSGFAGRRGAGAVRDKRRCDGAPSAAGGQRLASRRRRRSVLGADDERPLLGTPPRSLARRARARAGRLAARSLFSPAPHPPSPRERGRRRSLGTARSRRDGSPRGLRQRLERRGELSPVSRGGARRAGRGAPRAGGRRADRRGGARDASCPGCRPGALGGGADG